MICGVEFVRFVGSSTESDGVGRVALVIVVATVVVCAVVTGVAHGHLASLTTGAVVGIFTAGAAVGALIGASHARHERAWSDYRDTAHRLPAMRMDWLRSLGAYGRRLAIPVGAVLVAVFWLKGRR